MLSLTAGPFEETGHLLIMGRLLRRRRLVDGVAFGLGHGGLEAAALVGTSMIATIVMAVQFNAGRWDELAATMPPQAAEQLLAAFTGAGVGTVALAGATGPRPRVSTHSLMRSLLPGAIATAPDSSNRNSERARRPGRATGTVRAWTPAGAGEFAPQRGAAPAAALVAGPAQTCRAHRLPARPTRPTGLTGRTRPTL